MTVVLKLAQKDTIKMIVVYGPGKNDKAAERDKLTNKVKAAEGNKETIKQSACKEIKTLRKLC